MRDRLRLKTADRVEFLVREDGTALMVPATISVRDLEGLLPPPKNPVTLGDMERAMRRRAKGE